MPLPIRMKSSRATQINRFWPIQFVNCFSLIDHHLPVRPGTPVPVLMVEVSTLAYKPFLCRASARRVFVTDFGPKIAAVGRKPEPRRGAFTPVTTRQPEP